MWDNLNFPECSSARKHTKSGFVNADKVFTELSLGIIGQACAILLTQIDTQALQRFLKWRRGGGCDSRSRVLTHTCRDQRSKVGKEVS